MGTAVLLTNDVDRHGPRLALDLARVTREERLRPESCHDHCQELAVSRSLHADEVRFA